MDAAHREMDERMHAAFGGWARGGWGGGLMPGRSVARHMLEDWPVGGSAFERRRASSQDHGVATHGDGSRPMIDDDGAAVVADKAKAGVGAHPRPGLEPEDRSQALTRRSHGHPDDDGWSLASPIHRMGNMFPKLGPGGLVLDVSEEGGGYVVRADVPGARREDVKVSVRREGVTIEVSREQRSEQSEGGEASGEEETPKQNDRPVFRHVERSYGMMRRTVPLPEDADHEQVRARLENGVLTLHVGKLAGKQDARHVPVE